MDLRFLGTGAAEGNPPVYSRSADSLRIRSEGGPDLRTRSSLRIGEKYQIDFSPDNFRQMYRWGEDMYAIEHLLISHSHEDHFDFNQIVSKEMPACTNGKPLHVYLSRRAHDWLLKLLDCGNFFADMEPADMDGFWDRYRLCPLQHFTTYRAGDCTLETVAGNHRVAASGERSINYLVTTPDRKTLLYALDTGFYQDDSWEYLQGKEADVLIMDCTFGANDAREDYPAGHLDCYSFYRMVERMAAIGFIDSAARIFATHINPDQGWNHSQLQRFFDEREFSIIVAHDGLKVRA